jgi:hypothetical protein
MYLGNKRRAGLLADSIFSGKIEIAYADLWP